MVCRENPVQRVPGIGPWGSGPGRGDSAERAQRDCIGIGPSRTLVMSGVTSSGDKLGPLRAGKVGSIQPQQQPCARCATSSTSGRGAGAGRPESRTVRCRDRCGTSLDAFSRVMVYCRAYNRARVDGISQEGIITGNINKGIIYTGITAGNIIAGNMTGKGFIVMIIEYFIVINCIISICATSSSARAPRHGQRQAHHHRPGDRHHLPSRNGISSKINSITTSSSSRMAFPLCLSWK